ncbi:MAG: Ig-like domain-containing protein, partial [Gammaproteobacteria bacterium]|nr:Ig-like domain-containing protein [Gammaproteobacteria bacterium]
GTYSLSAEGGAGDYSWNSLSTDIVSVDANGFVTALAPGKNTLVLTDAIGQSINIFVEVRLVEIIAGMTTLTVGQLVSPLTAEGGVGSYVWNSDSPSVVDVGQDGNLNVLKAGSATISVTDQDGFGASILLSVNDVLSINQTDVTLVIGDTFSVDSIGGIGSYVWFSDNTSIATVNSSGVITAIAAGVALITVTDDSGQSKTISVDVSSFDISVSNTNMMINDPALQINASGGAEPYVWSVSDSLVATIDPTGLLTPVNAGVVRVRVTDANNNIRTIDVTVDVEIMLVNNQSLLVAPGDISQLNVTGGDGNYFWSSENLSIANVNSTGRVTANNRGKTKIIVTDGLGSSLSIDVEVREVSVSAASSSITVGDSVLLISASGGNGPYNWRSSNTSVATINSNGQLQAVSEGNVTITATDDDGFSGTINISVNAPAPAPAPDGGGGGGMGGGM